MRSRYAGRSKKSEDYRQRQASANESHFKFTPGTLSDAFLLLGDGVHLTLQDVKVKHNFIGVDLITLLACEAGLGSGQDANGIHQRQFRHAGIWGLTR